MDLNLPAVDFGKTTEVPMANTNEALTAEEQVIADRLVGMVVDYLENLNLIVKPIARRVVKRLLEKLQLAHLGEDAVGIIGEGVWRRLNAASVVDDPTHAAEAQIVKDIMHHVDGTMSIFVNGLRRKMLEAAGPEANDKIIREVALRTWPTVKARLGV